MANREEEQNIQGNHMIQDAEIEELLLMFITLFILYAELHGRLGPHPTVMNASDLHQVTFRENQDPPEESTEESIDDILAYIDQLIEQLGETSSSESSPNTTAAEAQSIIDALELPSSEEDDSDDSLDEDILLMIMPIQYVEHTFWYI